MENILRLSYIVNGFANDMDLLKGFKLPSQGRRGAKNSRFAMQNSNADPFRPSSSITHL